MGNEKKKTGRSINVCVGPELFSMLTKFCDITGQSKTVAVERAIEAYCSGSKSKTKDRDPESEDET